MLSLIEQEKINLNYGAISESRRVSSVTGVGVWPTLSAPCLRNATPLLPQGNARHQLHEIPKLLNSILKKHSNKTRLNAQTNLKC